MRRRQQATSSSCVSLDTLAMAIPGYGVAEQVIVGGFGNFLSIYNLVITGRILLSWFPQAGKLSVIVMCDTSVVIHQLTFIEQLSDLYSYLH